MARRCGRVSHCGFNGWLLISREFGSESDQEKNGDKFDSQDVSARGAWLSPMLYVAVFAVAVAFFTELALAFHAALRKEQAGFRFSE